MLLIGLYAGAAFGSRARGVQALVVFSAVYGLIYLLMRLEDFALLAGSIASFVGLAGAMYLTRNLDWYGGKGATCMPKARLRPPARRRSSVGQAAVARVAVRAWHGQPIAAV